jgi:hypothetical protein
MSISPTLSGMTYVGVSQRGEETADLKKSKLISGKKFAGLRGIPSVVGMVVLVSFIVTVGLAWVSGGYLLRAIRRTLRKKETPMDWYTIPGRGLGFAAESSAFAAPTMGPSI